MKKLLIVAVAACAAFASCQGTKSVKNFNELDSLSYAIGLDIIDQFGIRGLEDSTINGDALAAAVRDAFNKKPAMTMEAASAFINDYFQVRKPAKQKAENAKLIEEVKAANANIQTSESGLMYEITNPGDASVKAVNDADQVVVKYRGTLLDGKEFDKNDSTAFALNGVVPGFREGLKLIGKGGEATLWIPAELAYGPSGRGQLIPGNATLKFEVKVLDVIPATQAAQ